MTSTLKVQNIQYTDGDSAITIADGGGISNALNLTGGISNITNTTGGVVQEYSSGGTNYRSHSFLDVGTHRFSTSTALTIDFLIVGGGGGSAKAQSNTVSTGGAGAGLSLIHI